MAVACLPRASLSHHVSQFSSQMAEEDHDRQGREDAAAVQPGNSSASGKRIGPHKADGNHSGAEQGQGYGESDLSKKDRCPATVELQAPVTDTGKKRDGYRH